MEGLRHLRCFTSLTFPQLEQMMIMEVFFLLPGLWYPVWKINTNDFNRQAPRRKNGGGDGGKDLAATAMFHYSWQTCKNA